VERDGALLDLSVVPDTVATDAGPVGRIGVLVRAPDIPPEMLVHVDYGPVQALWRGIENTWLTSALTLRMLGKMLTLEVSTDNLSGPLTIAQYAGQSARTGANSFLLFLALVSISLGIINLLPIPVLDGGHLLYHLAEAIRRGPLPKEVMLWGQQIGILLLIGLMGLAFYNDIIRLLQ
jgi:regulator of sigma E protease